jgi:glycosyltransferase involved in cell wall biosynthesis
VRIGINALYLLPGQVGGTEIYLRHLIAALDSLTTPHEIVVFTNRETGRLGRHCVELPIHATSRPRRILYEQFALPGILRRERIDVVLNPGFTAPLFLGIPQVTVFHDLQHKRHPEYFRWFDLPFWRFFLWAAAHRSDCVIAVSEAARADMLTFYHLDPAKVSVVPHGVEPEFFQLASRREDGGYLLWPSTTHPHKNHVRFLHVFARFCVKNERFRLVLTGVRGHSAASVEALVRQLHLENRVELKGWIDRQDLYELFRRATGLVYPTLFEGFGMPVLEAMAAGLPVACSDIEPLKSMTAGAAILFNPNDDNDIERALEALTEGRAPAGGPARAAQFTWQTAANKTLKVIEDSLRA